MENSTEDFIPFQQELDLLQNYLSLEKTRFTDKFDYEINVDENLNQQNLLLPGMLIQPFLENAIWHGLRYRTEKGFLKLNFIKEKEVLKITIQDNGIGIQESKNQISTDPREMPYLLSESALPASEWIAAASGTGATTGATAGAACSAVLALSSPRSARYLTA